MKAGLGRAVSASRVAVAAALAVAFFGCAVAMAGSLAAPSPAELLSAAYLATGFIFAAAYVPKITRMLRDSRSTAQSHSLLAEVLWTLCRSIALLYVLWVARQPLIALVVSLDLVGRGAVVAAVIWSRRVPPPEPAQPAAAVDARVVHFRRVPTEALPPRSSLGVVSRRRAAPVRAAVN